MKIVLATNNQHKIKEIKKILNDPRLEIFTLFDFPGFPKPEETGETFEENAILKARAVCQLTNMTSVADDSGLEVDALNKAPGVKSARFAGQGCTYQDNNLKLLRLLKKVPTGKRTATFICIVAVVFDLKRIKIVEGKVSGLITEEQMGNNGFGYDPVFYYPPFGKTFAQLSPDVKNQISHRSVAFRKAKEILLAG